MISFRAEFQPVAGLVCARFEMRPSHRLAKLPQLLYRLRHATGKELQQAIVDTEQVIAAMRFELKRDKRMFRAWRKFNARIDELNARACPGLANRPRMPGRSRSSLDL